MTCGADNGGGAAGGREEVLRRLEACLNAQLALARADDFEALMDGAGELEDLLDRAARCPGGYSPRQAGQLARILRRHQELGLILAHKRSDLAAALRRSATGRKALKAYRQG